MAFSPHGLTHRPTVTGRRGMVAAAHPLAAQAGLRILMEGGNAIDAAVATAAALNVVEPYMSGLAGVGYMHIYSADKQEHQILDYIGRSPSATRLEIFTALEPSQDRGPLFPFVPGACAGWLEALRRYGTMDVATVFAPAIEYAEEGFAFTVKNYEFTECLADTLRDYPTAAATYLFDGKPPRPGEVLVQLDLAHTLRAIAEGGADLFYQGEIAEKMVRFLQENGGLITHADLRTYQPQWLDPICGAYREYQIYGPPPPCHAALSLQILKIMEGFEVGALGHNRAATLHCFIEACKLALADGLTYLSHESPPLDALLSADYAAERRRAIQERAQWTAGPRFVGGKGGTRASTGDPYGWTKTECTTHFDVIDANGNAVAVTQSLGNLFGAAVVIPGTGLLMNNGMWWFDRDPESPNVYAPNKILHAPVLPALIFDKHGLRMLIGTPGGFGILQTTVQMIMNVIDHNLNIQAAIEAPRLTVTNPGVLIDAEARIDSSVLAELAQMGHEINLLEPWSMWVGGGQGILVDAETGSLMGGADPRRDGYAIGW
jgi:gamma-glutamyltranspeptidase / glutathione hydrolase